MSWSCHPQLRRTPGSMTRGLLAALGVAWSVYGSGQTVATDAQSLAAQFPMLTQGQIEFITSPDALAGFGLTTDKVVVQLAGRDEAGVRAYVEALMEIAVAGAFQPGQDTASPIKANDIPEPLDITADAASIPLNPEAGNYNRSRILRPALFDEYKREPGPIDLHRYVNETGGIPTFANAPVAVRKDDLIAGQIEVAFVGVPLGLGSGWRDSHNAPSTLRGMYGLAGYDIYGGVDPTLVLRIADYANISVDNLAPETNMAHIREQIGDMLDAGTIPFVVGGDHSVMFATVAAMSDFYGETLGVVHLDAHHRAERDLDHVYSDRQPVSRLVAENLLRGEHLIQLGLRGPTMSAREFDWLRQQQVRYHTMAEVESRGWDSVADSVLAEARSLPGKVFISFDMSVLDPAFALAAGSPVPGGLTTREAQYAVRRLCAETDVAGFEMLDVAPYLDVSYQSALTANHLMHACLTGIALRKQGITAIDYLNTRAVQHGVE